MVVATIREMLGIRDFSFLAATAPPSSPTSTTRQVHLIPTCPLNPTSRISPSSPDISTAAHRRLSLLEARLSQKQRPQIRRAITTTSTYFPQSRPRQAPANTTRHSCVRIRLQSQVWLYLGSFELGQRRKDYNLLDPPGDPFLKVDKDLGGSCIDSLDQSCPLLYHPARARSSYHLVSSITNTKSASFTSDQFVIRRRCPKQAVIRTQADSETVRVTDQSTTCPLSTEHKTRRTQSQ